MNAFSHLTLSGKVTAVFFSNWNFYLKKLKDIAIYLAGKDQYQSSNLKCLQNTNRSVNVLLEKQNSKK